MKHFLYKNNLENKSFISNKLFCKIVKSNNCIVNKQNKCFPKYLFVHSGVNKNCFNIHRTMLTCNN